MIAVIAAMLGFAAGVLAMIWIYGDARHAAFLARMDGMRAWANGEPTRPANDCSEAPERARIAGL